MPRQTCMGATLRCIFGLAPSKLIVLPINRVFTNGKPDANIGDHLPDVNIQSFGLCSSPTNPAVIAETAAALGVPTPALCEPMTPAPWIPGAATILLGNQPSLSSDSKLMCVWTGMISIIEPGEETVEIM